MLKELTEYGNNIKKTQEEIKMTLSEIGKNLQGTKSGGDKAETQIDNLEYKEKNKHLTRTAIRKKQFKKDRDNIRSLWNISKCTNI